MARNTGMAARYADGFAITDSGPRYTFEDEKGNLHSYTPEAVARELGRAGKPREAADVTPALAQRIERAKGFGVRAADIGLYAIEKTTVKDEKGNNVETFTAPPTSPLGAGLVSLGVWDYEAEDVGPEEIGAIRRG